MVGALFTLNSFIMKTYTLIFTIRIEVSSSLTLSKAVQELETETNYSIGSTENVTVLETEILESFISDTKQL
ncbi:hypothetical protein LY11_03418 [Pedobacter cryoconitis]|uniref:Uncharacterized protein n=2 Tax=Pedobacter cryoconitis TaxID=188932 RepID=A0A327SHC3_9SPHI|nr:hypothetical protein LY11_03418 [Pedobacter cryoconitis]